MRIKRGVLKSYSGAISAFSQLLDVVLCTAGGLMAYQLRFDFSAMPVRYSELILIGGLLVFLVFRGMGVYQSWRSRGWLEPAGRALLAWIVVFLLLMVFLVATKQAEMFSRLWILHWLLWVSLFVMMVRLVVYLALRALRRRGFNRRNVVVIGDGNQARDLVRMVRGAAWTGFDVAAAFGVDDGTASIEGIMQQPLNALGGYVDGHSVDEVWITFSLEHSGKVREVLEQLRYCTANVRYAPDFFGLFLLNRGVTEILDVPMIDLSASPMQGVNRIVKSLEDRLLAALILLLVSPIMLLIAVGVKLGSPGPVFFKQERHGWDGQRFWIYKFRSMLMHEETTGVVAQAQVDDPRVTGFGRFLRRSSLDELPQFINVFKGEMSIVGPRPHAVEHNEQYKRLVGHYMLRHKVKPGITGWAQINGWRGETESVKKMQGRVEHDLYYIENWSLWFDLKIIFLTLFKGFVNKNAY